MLAKLKLLTDPSREEAAFYLLLPLAVALLLMQTMSLYTTPIPDSYLWWGDESWLTIEFGTQILEGVFRHPYALGSSLEHGSGLIFGNMWITALLYGTPAALLKNADIVLIGRSVTALLSLTLLVSLYEVIQRLTSDRIMALLGTILLLSSRSFLFTSHSARYDILTSLSILIVIFFLFQIIDRSPLTWLQSLLVGFAIGATLLITIHVTLAIGIAAFLSILVNSRGRRFQNAAIFCIGAAIFILLLIGINQLRGTSSLFGGSATSAYYLNLRDIPALRPFSRSVQIANLTQRWNTLTTLSLGYIIMLLALTLLAIYSLWRKRISVNITTQKIILLVAFVSWLLFESSAPTSYLIYILPLLSIGIVLTIRDLLPERVGRWVAILGGVILCLFGLADAPLPHGVGKLMTTQNEQAVDQALESIEPSDNHDKPDRHPLVLAFNPAIHRVLLDTNVRLMTTHFVEFPEADKFAARSVQDIIRKEKVDYILLYKSAVKPDYMREVGPIAKAAQSMGTLVFERADLFTDIGRSYFSSSRNLPDTIQLYRVHE